mgnify:FL=1|jgi:hypothetical protein
MNLSEIVNNLKERKSSLEFQTRLHSGLISHNYIVEVGANTVCSVDGKATLKSKAGSELPSQWTTDGVKEIKEKCSWTNMLGEKMQIKAINYKDWYAKELKSVNETLENFEPLVK